MEDKSPKNAYISDPEHLADGIVIRMLLEDGKKDRAQVVLVLDENTNFDSLNRNRKVIKALLSAMDKSQGSDLTSQLHNKVYSLFLWHEEKYSWNKMNMLLNFLAITFAYSSYVGSENNRKPELDETARDNMADYLSGFGSLLFPIFIQLGKTESDVNEWMDEGFKAFRNRKWILPITDYPFDRETTRLRVRYFQDGIRFGKLFITTPRPVNILEWELYTLHRFGYVEAVEKLLEEHGPQDWGKNKKIIHAMVRKIIKKWDDSLDSEVIKLRENIRKAGKN